MKKVVFGLQLALFIGSALLVHVYQVPPPALADKPIKSQTSAVNTKQNSQSQPQEQTTAANAQAKPTPNSQPKPKPVQVSSTQPVKQAQASKALTASVQNAGQAIVANTLHYTVKDAKVSWGEGPIKPGDGNIYLLINLTIQNTGSDPVSISPVMVFNLVDSNQNSYAPIILNQNEEAIDGMLGPGREVSGQLRFEVPQTLDKVTLQIDSSEVGAQTAKVLISIKHG